MTDAAHIYSRNFAIAWQLSREITPAISGLKEQDGRLIGPDPLEFIAISVSDISGGNVDRIAGECLNIHAQLADRLRNKFGWEVYLTLGSVEVLGDEWASFDSITARRLFEKGLASGEKFKGHCWLTLPTLEIIDATIQTTLAKQTRNSELIGNITAQHVSKLNNAFDYHPIVLGEYYTQAVFGVERPR